MGPDQLVFLIPITAIVLGIGSGIIKSILSSQERRLEMRMRSQQGQNDEVSRQIQALRAEVASLRDTSTQFDMSLDNAMRHLSERVAGIEARTAPRSITPAAEESTQQVGLR